MGGAGMGCTGVLLLALAGQETARESLDRVLELNRGGSWAEAAALAEELARGELPPAQAAEALAMAGYAYSRLDRLDPLRRSLERFDALEGVPEEHWSHREIRSLRAGLRPDGRRARGGDGHWNFAPLVAEDDFWRPAEEELVEALEDFVSEHRRLCEKGGADALVVVVDGRIVDEWSAEGATLPCGAMSSTKSVTSLLVGQLIADGKLRGVEQPVSDFLPEWSEGRRAEVQLLHLLNHSSGLTNRAARGELGVGGPDSAGDKNAYVRALVPDVEPGTIFSYSNEGVQLLSPILEEAAGEPLHHYAERRLFEPLGMDNTRLRIDGAGHAWTYGDMITTPRDLARLGVLMVQRGIWEGRRIVPEEWIERSIAPGQEFEPRCGLLWWRFPETEAFAAQGYLGTDVHVFPRRGLVVVRVQRRPGDGGNPGSAYRRALHELVGGLPPSR